MPQNKLWRDIYWEREDKLASLIKNCEVISYSETRELEYIYDRGGRAINAHPIPGSERATLDLQLPNGKIITVNVLYDDFIRDIIPLFLKAMPIDAGDGE